jgi:hypothetical protein
VKSESDVDWALNSLNGCEGDFAEPDGKIHGTLLNEKMAANKIEENQGIYAVILSDNLTTQQCIAQFST